MGMRNILSVGLLIALLGTPEAGAKARFSAQWWQERWIARSATREESHREILAMLEILKTTRAGAELVQIARTRDPQFLRRLDAGDNSLTETVFSRSFSLQDGSESLEVENFLRLNRNLSRKDLILDLGHELMHFVHRSPANPYGERHTLREFIRDGIEGRGGELDAFMAECRVSWELERSHALPEHDICLRYRRVGVTGESEFAREEARREYYNVGRHYGALSPLKKYFPELSDKSVIFSSSLQKAPYPYALVKEFAYVRRVACENNERKAKLIANQAARLRKSRTPASTLDNLARERTRLEEYARTNCAAAGTGVAKNSSGSAFASDTLDR